MKELLSTPCEKKRKTPDGFFEAQRVCRCSTFTEWNTWWWNLELQCWRYRWDVASSRCTDRSSWPAGVPDSKWTTAAHIMRLRRQKAAAPATISLQCAAFPSRNAFRRNFCNSGKIGISKVGGTGNKIVFECRCVSKQHRPNTPWKKRKSSQTSGASKTDL